VSERVRGSSYVPDEGDIVWIELSPTLGREQGGHRPAVVLTKARFNDRSNLMLCAPMTSQAKNYPFEVAVGSGVALVDQARSVDWKARKITHKGNATTSELEAVRAKLRKLIG
jgi:mRNA interferase MazF